MSAHEDAAVKLARQAAHDVLDELPDLGAAALVPREPVRDGVPYQQVGVRLIADLLQRLECRRQGADVAPVEGHQHVVKADARDVSDLLQVGGADAVGVIDALLTAVQFVRVILTHYAHSEPVMDRHSEPVAARADAGEELLRQ